MRLWCPLLAAASQELLQSGEALVLSFQYFMCFVVVNVSCYLFCNLFADEVAQIILSEHDRQKICKLIDILLSVNVYEFKRLNILSWFEMTCFGHCHFDICALAGYRFQGWKLTFQCSSLT